MVKNAFHVIIILGLTVGSSASVWQGMDQDTLDAAYDQSVYAPNLEQVLARFATNSERVRDRLGAPQQHAYGSGNDETLDVYRSNLPNAPVVVFIHGGAWRAGLARDNAHAAELFVRNGIHCVIPDFSPVQAFNGDLGAMVEQLTRALLWIQKDGPNTFGANADRIYLVGFSSGAHLASALLIADEAHIPKSLIRGAVLCSGMYDLAPVALSSRRTYVAFTPASIQQLSAVYHLDKIHCPLVIAYGSHESPEFIRQANDFSSALRALGHPHHLIRAENYNHFEIIETLANPYGILGAATLDLINQVK